MLSGRPQLRTPDGIRRLEPGAVVAFPRGHGRRAPRPNPGDEPARVLLVSTMNLPEVAEHLTTGTLLTMPALGAGRAFDAAGERPFLELYQRAMELDAERISAARARRSRRSARRAGTRAAR